jgi:hypothetical protein
MALLDLQAMETPIAELATDSSSSNGHSCDGSDVSLALCEHSDLSVALCLN